MLFKNTKIFGRLDVIFSHMEVTLYVIVNNKALLT